MLRKHVIFPFSSTNYIVSVDYIFFAEYYIYFCNYYMFGVSSDIGLWYLLIQESLVPWYLSIT